MLCPDFEQTASEKSVPHLAFDSVNCLGLSLDQKTVVGIFGSAIGRYKLALNRSTE
jgi:hypothetical protein